MNSHYTFAKLLILWKLLYLPKALKYVDIDILHFAHAHTIHMLLAATNKPDIIVITGLHHADELFPVPTPALQFVADRLIPLPPVVVCCDDMFLWWKYLHISVCFVHCQVFCQLIIKLIIVIEHMCISHICMNHAQGILVGNAL